MWPKPRPASTLPVPHSDVSPLWVAVVVVVGILASLTLVAGTNNASASTSSASLRPVLNTNALEVAVVVVAGASNVDLTKCGKPAVAPPAGNKNAQTLALGLLGVALLTAAQAASARKDTREATMANALSFATCSDVLILLTKAFSSPLF